MPIRRLGRIAAILLLSCCSFPVQGTEQHISFDTETDFYELMFDDQVISYSDMQRIAWLSPLIDPTLPHAPFMTTIARSPGKIEKNVIALPLQTCMPGYECMHSTLDETFLRNAAEVLKTTRQQLELLKAEPFPAALEPVRSYLVLTLQSTLAWKEAEYAYLRDSSMKALGEQFCQYCSCSGNPGRKNPQVRDSPDRERIPGLLERMAAAKDPAKRLEFATHDFENALVDCFAAMILDIPYRPGKTF